MNILKSLAFVVILAIGSNVTQAGVINSDFTGAYDVANWTATTQGNSSVITSGAPNSVTLIGSNSFFNFGLRDVAFEISAQASGQFEFDWDYSTNDFFGPFADPAFFINGSDVDLLTTNPLLGSQSGSVSVAVNAGDQIGWRVRSFTNVTGRATLNISNFRAPVVPEPTSFMVWSLAGMAFVGVGRRRKS